MKATQRGFTIVEMVLVVSVIGIAAAAAGIGIGQTVQKAQRAAERERLVVELRAERDLARNRQRPMVVAIVPGTDGRGASMSIQSVDSCGAKAPVGDVRAYSYTSIAPSLPDGNLCFNSDGTLTIGTVAAKGVGGGLNTSATLSSVSLSTTLAAPSTDVAPPTAMRLVVDDASADFTVPIPASGIIAASFINGRNRDEGRQLDTAANTGQVAKDTVVAKTCQLQVVRQDGTMKITQTVSSCDGNGPNVCCVTIDNTQLVQGGDHDDGFGQASSPVVMNGVCKLPPAATNEVCNH
jgi:prepilin-type N-terminal cleavage/methylation domain-containing protein